MESSRIPKSYIKAPTRLPKFGNVGKLAAISENKVSVPSTTTTQPAVNRAAALRRRSKSVSDLRPLMSRPALNGRPVLSTRQDTVLNKAAIKRPATSKPGNEPTKPKVPKVKIPDWDYKSRFQELQKKHTTIVEDMKQMKSDITKLAELQIQIKELTEDNRKTHEENEVLSQKEKKISEENSDLLKENNSIRNEFSKKVEAYENLKSKYETLQEKNKENLHELTEIKSMFRDSQITITSLTQKNEDLEKLVRELKEDIEEKENVRRALHNTIQDMKGNIRVFCRVRPPVTMEENDKQLCAMFFPSDSNLEIRKSRESVSTISGKAVDLKQEFTFDKVFPPEANQAEVFDELSQLVQSALDGYHVCVFAYGQTGSGKTFTMQGTANDHGMIPRTIDLIFEKIKKFSTHNWVYTVTASFLEIYNENIRDLLDPNSTHNYELRFNEGRGVTVTNLQTVPIGSATELKNLMEEAHHNRAVAATDFNEHSSRSHAVTKINLEGYNETTKAKYSGSINLVDLAGSESAKTSSGERLNETKSINKSLSTLGNVMLALHNKDPHIPYRNSKLTFLLQSCLGGNSKTLMFVNISPFEECFGESINSLRFASKVKDVKTVAKKNKTYCAVSTPQPKI